MLLPANVTLCDAPVEPWPPGDARDQRAHHGWREQTLLFPSA